MTSFDLIDWLVLALYLAVVVLIGLVVARRQPRTQEGFFLAGRRMPILPVAISVVATALSGATFLGTPEQAFKGDLTYASATIGSVLAALLAAWWFIPRYHEAGITSIYQLLTARLGHPGGQAASGAFLIGRVFASGARLFICGIPLAWIIAGGEPAAWELCLAIAALAALAAVYTTIGGIGAVIWTDVLQAVVLVCAGGVAIGLLLHLIPDSPREILQLLRAETTGEPAHAKLRVFDLGLDRTRAYTLPAICIGFTLINLGAYATDQDLAQRLLTCPDRRTASRSLILGVLLGVPVVLLFLLIGLLLFVFYRGHDPAAPEMSGLYVMTRFLLEEMPMGMKGLAVAGLVAAGMSSLDSALNAMASASVADFYSPWRQGRHGLTVRERRQTYIVSKLLVPAWAAVIAAFACACIGLKETSALPLIDFALSVMLFAYSGLLAVFFTAVLTNRGNGRSALAAIIAGFLVTLLMQTHFWGPLVGREEPLIDLAFPWQMVISTGVAFLVAISGKRPARLRGDAAKA